MNLDIATLQDRLAIEDVLNAYAHLLDTGAAAGVVDEVFTHDAEIHMGDMRVAGREAIAAAFAGAPSSRTSHNLTNIQVKISGDKAAALSRVIAWHWTGSTGNPLAPADMVMVGGYQDRFRRTAQGWRIQSRIGYGCGTGIGVGTAPASLVDVIAGMAAVVPAWPAEFN